MKANKIKKEIVRDEEGNIVTISVSYTNKFGHFKGVAKTHPEDLCIATEEEGTNLAILRADIQYMKVRKKVAKERYKTLKGFIVNSQHFKGYDNDSLEAKCLRRRAAELKTDYFLYRLTLEKLQALERVWAGRVK